MLSVQRQLENRAKRLRIDCLKRKRETSDKTLLSQVFSQWRTYKRIDEPIEVIQRFMRSIWYIIKLRILMKNHQEPDSATHTVHQFDRFMRMEQNRESGISESRDSKNNKWTRLKVFIIGFVRTHNPVVDEQSFIQRMREMLSRDEFDIIKPAYGQTFIQFFEFARKTREESRNGCATTIRSKQLYGIDLLWILYYLSSKRLPKGWFPNPESDFAFVFEELRTIVSQKVQEEEEHHRAIMDMGTPYQPDYCPEPCSLCGSETIQGTCFNAECMRRRERACASCGNPIEGSNVVEVDGMRLHPDCANHNQHNSHFRDYTECSACGCSSNDMSFVEGIGLVCDRCISVNQ
jgi:hypothetical protein